MLRKANAHWQGSTKEGSGTLSTQSGTLRDTPYSDATRFAQVASDAKVSCIVSRALSPSITITLDAALVP